MNEEKLIEALTEILMNHETGPLSNLGSGLHLNDDGEIEVQTNAVHPFGDSVDVPHLARELLVSPLFSAAVVPEQAEAVPPIVGTRSYVTLGDIADELRVMRQNGMTLASVLYAADRVWPEEER